MALSTYTELAAAVADWLNRQGADDITINAENFIDLAQRRVQREVRVPPMEVLVEDLTITDGIASIPTAMLDVKEMLARTNSCAWEVQRSIYSRVKREQASAGQGPRYFDTVADNFVFGPEPSSGVTVDLVYYQEIEFISPAVAQNWFSQYAPELILFGALAEAAIFMKDTEQEQKYDAKYTQVLQGLKDQKQRAEYSGRLQVNT